MVNYNIIKKLPRRITTSYYKLKAITKKIQKSASTIGFIEQAIYHQFTPTFAKVQRNFIDKRETFVRAKKFTKPFT